VLCEDFSLSVFKTILSNTLPLKRYSRRQRQLQLLILVCNRPGVSELHSSTIYSGLSIKNPQGLLWHITKQCLGIIVEINVLTDLQLSTKCW